MSHPISDLQTGLVAALAGDAELVGLIGSDAVFDAPPRGAKPPYVAIVRHEALSRDGVLAPFTEHRLVLNAWHPDPNRSAVVAIVERLVAVATGGEISAGAHIVTHAVHLRTETAIDGRTGHARAAVTLRIHTEPTS